MPDLKKISIGLGILAAVCSIITILWAVGIYIYETDDREQQRINILEAKLFRAWSLINAYEGKSLTGGRKEALETLHSARRPLDHINLSKAYIPGVKLSGASLSYANLTDADLAGADLSKANLYSAELQKAWLVKVNLRGAVLRKANLHKAVLREVDLSDADLRNANLSQAALYDAELGGADLSGTDLRSAFLEDATFSRTDLDGANLRGVMSLTCGQLTKAVHWQNTLRDEELSCGAPVRKP
jgi:uncharacterized protein YjbI with pentapeptide repeats